MAKRAKAVGKMKKTRSHKTKKRLAAKAEMLRIKALRPSERKKALQAAK